MASFTTSFASTPEQPSDEWVLQGSVLSKNGKSVVVLDEVKRGVYGTHLSEGTRTYWLELAARSIKPTRIIVAWFESEPAHAIDSAFHELVAQIGERMVDIDSVVRFNQSEGHRPERRLLQLLASVMAVLLVVVLLFGWGGAWQGPIGLALLAGGIWWWRDTRAVTDDALTPSELAAHVSPRIVGHSGG